MPGHGRANQEPCHAIRAAWPVQRGTHCSTSAGQTALSAGGCTAGRLGTRLADHPLVEPDWTCPFCSLLCDGFALERTPEALVLHGTDCPRARAGLAAHARREAPAAFIDGGVAPVEEAIAEAARR